MHNPQFPKRTLHIARQLPSLHNATFFIKIPQTHTNPNPRAIQSPGQPRLLVINPSGKSHSASKRLQHLNQHKPNQVINLPDEQQEVNSDLDREIFPFIPTGRPEAQVKASFISRLFIQNFFIIKQIFTKTTYPVMDHQELLGFIIQN